ncbi:MAG: TonB-dependent receptor [Gammaproteobacteria bacterium]
MQPITRVPLAFLAMLAASPGGAVAQVAAGPGLGVIEVIAHRDTEAIVPMDLIGARQLESAATRDLGDALDLLPAVTLTRVGARNETLVQLRGYDSRQVPLFIDGVPVYVPYDGNIDLARLGVGDISQIRVSKAGGSVLYGPNALGGAINVVTALPGEGLTSSARAGLVLDEGGAAQRTDTGGRLGYRSGHWYAQGSAFLLDQDFFRIPDGHYGPAEDGGRRENSSTRDLTTGLKLGWQGDSGAGWQLNYVRLDGSKGTPPYAGTSPEVRPRYWRWPYYDKEDLYLLGALPLGDTLWLRTRLYYDRFANRIESFDNANYDTQARPYAFDSQYDDHAYGGSIEAEMAPGGAAGVTRAVVHFKNDVHREVDNTGQPWEEMEDRTWSLAVEHTRTLAATVTGSAGVGWNALDSVRADNNVGGVIAPFHLEDDSAFNATAGLRWVFTPGWGLDVNLARKTRFPTLKDRYSYRLGTALPNPGLQAEQADHVELGVAGDLAGVATRAAVFGSWLDDAIGSVSLPATACSSPPCSQLQNVGRQRRRGVELSLARTLPVVGELSLGWSYLDVDNLSQPQVRAIYTPHHKLQLASSTPLGERVRLRLGLKVEDGRLSTSNGSRTTAGFGIVDAGLDIGICRGLRLLLEGRNLANRLYAYDEGFPEAGRSWAATLVWNPGKVLP